MRRRSISTSIETQLDLVDKLGLPLYAQHQWASRVRKLTKPAPEPPPSPSPRHATGRRLPKIFGQDYSYYFSKHP